MAHENGRNRRAAADTDRSADGSPLPPIRNPAVARARPRRNYWLPWVLLGLALLALLLMLTQCGRDENKINEAIALDRATQQQQQQQQNTAAVQVVPGPPGTYQMGTLAYDVNQYLIANARRQKTFTFGALNFDPGSARIRDIDRSDIGALANALSSHPNFRAAVVGYADAASKDTSSARLGFDRAQAVVAALGERGVDTSNIAARSGDERSTARGSARNRRTEFILLAH